MRRRNQQYFSDDDVMHNIQNMQPTHRQPQVRQGTNGWSVGVFVLMLISIGIGLAKCG